MYTEEGHAEYFELGTILSVTNGVNFTGDFRKIEQLMFYIFDTEEMTPDDIAYKREEASTHILTIHPELKGIILPKGVNINRFLIDQESAFGTHLPITKLGLLLPKNPEMNLIPNKKASEN